MRLGTGIATYEEAPVGTRGLGKTNPITLLTPDPGPETLCCVARHIQRALSKLMKEKLFDAKKLAQTYGNYLD